MCYLDDSVKGILSRIFLELLHSYKAFETDIPLPWTSHGHIGDTALSPLRECSTIAASILLAQDYCISESPEKGPFCHLPASFEGDGEVLCCLKRHEKKTEVCDRTVQQQQKCTAHRRSFKEQNLMSYSHTILTVEGLLPLPHTKIKALNWLMKARVCGVLSAIICM